MTIITQKISNDKVNAIWYYGRVIAETENYILTSNGYVSYKELENTKAIELLQKDVKNDVEIWELWTDQQKNSSNFGMCFPEFYINGENIECDNYDDAIIALERISEI